MQVLDLSPDLCPLVDGVNLRATTAGTVFIDAEAEDSVVKAHQIGSSTTVEGLCFRNGSAEAGGGLHAIGSSPTFRNCIFESNGAAIGGGASYCVPANCSVAIVLLIKLSQTAKSMGKCIWRCA